MYICWSIMNFYSGTFKKFIPIWMLIIQELCFNCTETTLAMCVLIDFANNFASIKIVTEGYFSKHFFNHSQQWVTFPVYISYLCVCQFSLCNYVTFKISPPYVESYI